MSKIKTAMIDLLREAKTAKPEKDGFFSYLPESILLHKNNQPKASSRSKSYARSDANQSKSGNRSAN